MKLTPYTVIYAYLAMICGLASIYIPWAIGSAVWVYS